MSCRYLNTRPSFMHNKAVSLIRVLFTVIRLIFHTLAAPDFGLSLDSSRLDAAFPRTSKHPNSYLPAHNVLLDWNLMTAATISDSLSAIRNGLIKSTYRRAFMPDSDSPLPVTYKPSNGDPLSGSGRSVPLFILSMKRTKFCSSPILGAAFALAAINMGCITFNPIHKETVLKLLPVSKVLIQNLHQPPLLALLKR